MTLIPSDMGGVSTGREKLREVGEKETLFLDGPDADAYAFVLDRIRAAKTQREQRYPEFNGLTFLEDYNANLQISYSYLRPRLNDAEVRVNTATVEKKVMTVANEIYGVNMQHEIRAFDQDDREVQELGDDFGAIVKRTNEWEQDQDMRLDAIVTLLTQRALFLEEVWDVRTVTDKRKRSFDHGRVRQSSFSTGRHRVERPRKRIMDPLKVFLGDMSIPLWRLNEQPFIVTYELMSYKQAETVFGGFERWKYVKPGSPSGDWYDGRFNFRFDPATGPGEVEIVKYRSFPDDEFQVVLNGVPIFAPGEPLPWEWEGYDIRGFTYRGIHNNFAYGQTFLINSRSLGLLKDESLRLMIYKWRQALKPPLGVRGNKVLSRDVWDPGAVVQGVGKDDFERLISHDGVTPSEMGMLDLISRQITEELQVSAMMQGTEGRKLTATQTVEQSRQAVKALGLAIVAWSRVVREMTYLRVYNILENGTRPSSLTVQDGKVRQVFRSFTVQGVDLGNETRGTKVVAFTDRDLTEKEQEGIYDYEEKMAAQGEHIRIKSINVKKLRAVPIQWYVAVTPQEQETSSLQKVLFQDKLTQGANITRITGRQMNADHVIEDFERTWKARGMFQEAAPQGTQGGPEGAQGILAALGAPGGLPGGQMGQPEQGPETPGGGQPPPMEQSKRGAQMERGVKFPASKPGVKQIVNAP